MPCAAFVNEQLAAGQQVVLGLCGPVCHIWHVLSACFVCRSKLSRTVKDALQGQVEKLENLKSSYHLNFVVSMAPSAAEADISLPPGDLLKCYSLTSGLSITCGLCPVHVPMFNAYILSCTLACWFENNLLDVLSLLCRCCSDYSPSRAGPQVTAATI